jgi:hypothetical protein
MDGMAMSNGMELSLENELAIRQQFRTMARMGITVYRSGVEYPPLSEDDYVRAAEEQVYVDLCREHKGRIVFWDNLVIRP